MRVTGRARQELLRAALLCAATILILGLHVCAQDVYFPAGSFDSDKAGDLFMAQWFFVQLEALEEPSLLSASRDRSAESYRFLWLRTFHHPVSVRVEIQADGSATLTTKVADGAGGFSPGKLIKNETRTLAKSDTDKLLLKISSLGFWSLPAYNSQERGNDGAEWALEGVSHGRYHIVTRWSPQKGPIDSLGRMFLFDLAHLRIPRHEIY